jgi:endonuclease-3
VEYVLCFLLDAAVFEKVLQILFDRYPETLKPLHVSDESPFKVLVGALLSHRTRDENTDKAYSQLFSRFRDAEDLAKASVRDIQRLIRPVGFYRQKARRIKEIARIILEEYGGRVPESREELMKLPGIGPKSADIVLSTVFGRPEVAVDTHVETVAKRLGLAGENAGYEEVKAKITSLAPREALPYINMLFVRFGREICRKPRPKCDICPVKEYCRYYREVFRDRAPPA